MALISVVVPVYNGALTIGETIQSVLNQTYSDIEIIVVNDGSTDTTREILSNFEDPRLRVIDFANAGLSASRNRGIALARGECISFLDADDMWVPKKLEAQQRALAAHPDAAVSYSWTNFIDMSGKPLGYGITPIESGDVFPNLLVHFFIGSGSNALLRKEVFKKVGPFDESLTAAEDWEMFLRIAAEYPFVVVQEPHVLYRITDNSMSRNVLRQEQQCLKVLNWAFEREPGKSMSHLKAPAFANLYLYLAAHALRGVPNRKSGIIAARFLLRASGYQWSILKRTKQISILVAKMITVILLPPDTADRFRKAVKKLSRPFFKSQPQ